jgi:hypothetical protein
MSLGDLVGLALRRREAVASPVVRHIWYAGCAAQPTTTAAAALIINRDRREVTTTGETPVGTALGWVRQPTRRHTMQAVARPRRERRTPPRGRLQMAKRQHRRRPRDPIDRRTPSGQLLPF